MKYKSVVEGEFVKRINRFIAEVKIDGCIESVHVKNTGRCKELFVEGRKVYLEKSDKSDRKTKYSIISIYKGDLLINIDSQVPNAVVFDALQSGKIDGFENIDILCREKMYKNSRFDIYYRMKNGTEGFIEVKGVTLEEDSTVMFPDAPTKRGCKHVAEMEDAVQNGYEGNIFFLVQMDKADIFKPNRITDKMFADTLNQASKNGVKIFVYTSDVTRDTITVKDRIKDIKLD